jgi:hypothetical protein
MFAKASNTNGNEYGQTNYELLKLKTNSQVLYQREKLVTYLAMMLVQWTMLDRARNVY